jgi:hypothetical protein
MWRRCYAPRTNALDSESFRSLSSPQLRIVAQLPSYGRGRIIHIDGMVAGCTNDDMQDCAGLDERHEGDPVVCWRWFSRCGRCGIQP